MKSNILKGRKVLMQVALKNGVPVSEVRTEIEKAIQVGVNSPDPAVKARWTSLCNNGAIPTPEELVAICTGQRPLRHSSAATWPSAAATLFRWQIWV